MVSTCVLPRAKRVAVLEGREEDEKTEQGYGCRSLECNDIATTDDDDDGFEIGMIASPPSSVIVRVLVILIPYSLY